MFPDRQSAILTSSGCVLLAYAVALVCINPKVARAEENPAQETTTTPSSTGSPALVPAGNPINTIQLFGTGELGRLLGLSADGALRIGGISVINATGQWLGGAGAGQESAGGYLVVGASLDLGKAINWKGAQIGIAGLQYNVQNTNQYAGSVQGIVSSDSAPPPNNRSELYNYFFAQDLFDSQLQLMIGKLIPMNFGNATAPDPLAQRGDNVVPTLTSLLYAPVFVVPTMMGRIPGYPDSALGVTVTVAPDVLQGSYLSAGVFDGRLGADGTTTGLVSPSLDGPLFSIVQVGTDWALGQQASPGKFFVGAWHQGGPIKQGKLNESSAWGLYGQISQRLSHFRYGRDSSGINVFVQTGWTPSTTNLIQRSVGGGLTVWAPFSSRPQDSYGMGISWATPNSDPLTRYGFRKNELLLQAYAQIHLINSLFLQPTLSLLPQAGIKGADQPSFSGSIQLTALF